MNLPRITVVTPSLNQGAFIEQTLRSVLDQRYPNLEYIVIDGGSTDGTVDIIRRYESRISYWVSERDHGQADAINKGFAVGTGEICAFLNSDDIYEPGALERVAADFGQADRRCWHAYPVQDFNADGMLDLRLPAGGGKSPVNATLEERNQSANELRSWVAGRTGLHQPGTFWRREQWDAVGGLDDRYHYAFDRHFFMKLVSAGYPLITHGGPPIARFRVHDDSKTGQYLKGVHDAFFRERMKIADAFVGALPREEQREISRLRVNDEISATWRLFRGGAPRATCFAWLGQIALSRQYALKSRFFWGTVLRFLFGPRPALPASDLDWNGGEG
jgi:glycosyltransferase involved in cell wall biosynthesis